MYIEQVMEKEEVSGGDKKIVVSRGNVTKMALVGVGARALFYPTLVYNVVRNKVEAEFHWWDRVAQVILLLIVESLVLCLFGFSCPLPSNMLISFGCSVSFYANHSFFLSVLGFLLSSSLYYWELFRFSLMFHG